MLAMYVATYMVCVSKLIFIWLIKQQARSTIYIKLYVRTCIRSSLRISPLKRSFYICMQTVHDYMYIICIGKAIILHSLYVCSYLAN